MHFKGNLKKKFLEAFAWGEKGKKKKKLLLCQPVKQPQKEELRATLAKGPMELDSPKPNCSKLKLLSYIDLVLQHQKNPV